MFIARTPYRLSFYGGGLDYSQWYNEHPTNILCAGLDYYCYQTVRELPPFFNHNYRIAYSSIETVNKIDEIKHRSAREGIRKYGKGKNIEITHVGDLPAKSGIGSSSSFTVGLISSLSALDNKFIGRTKLALAAINLEQNEMKENVGVQDQCAAAFGGFVHIKASKEGIHPRRFLCRPNYIDYIESSLLMGFTGIQRFSSVASTKIKNNILKQDNKSKLQELALASQEGIDLFANEADISENARVSRICRDIKMSMNEDENNKDLQELITATEDAGSLCTRVIGAGGGGFFICWAPNYRHQEVMSKVNVKTWVKVRFSKLGCQLIFAEP